MSFVDLFTAMKSAYCAYGCPVPIYIGPQWLQIHTETTRVILYQAQDVYEKASVSVPVGTPGYTRHGINPRPIATRKCGAIANIWASAPEQDDPDPVTKAERQYKADLALLDILINQTCVVLQQVAGGIHVLAGGMAEDGNAAASRSGLGYVMNFSVDTPIIDMPWSVAIDACRKTWTEAPATAEITIEGAVDNSTTPPGYQAAVTYVTPP